MKVIAVNGSPRKKWNTARMLQSVLAGSESQGAETELVHLYDLNFKGCTSCFSCKIIGGKSYGRCAMRDDLTPVLERVAAADALVLGSPIYFGCVTGEMRSFLERLLFQYLRYTRERRTTVPKPLRTAWVYTMNCPEAFIGRVGYDNYFKQNEQLMRFLSAEEPETLCSYETLQFEDYSLVDSDMFDVEARQKRHREIFPQDLQKAYELGVRLAKKA
ncbi:MAG TPA: flavodoxin family protein [Firmicutes bacterium]|nr:flavodoxin family protein [Bacillota bacterium]